MSSWLSNRAILVGVLVAIGVISGIAAPAIAGGATAEIIGPQVMKEIQVNALGNGSFVVTTSDGKVLGTISAMMKEPVSASKGTILKINTSDRKVTLCVGGSGNSRTLSGSVIYAPELTKEQKKKAMDIAAGDPRVQKLGETLVDKDTNVSVKGFKILSIGPNIAVEDGKTKVVGATIWMAANGKCYLVEVSFESNSVTAIYPVECPKNIDLSLTPSS